jgi:hypothetical protein
MNGISSAHSTDSFVVCNGVSAREFDGEWIVLDLQRGSYFGLDEVGGKIWECLCAGRSPAEIVEVLAAKYDAPKAKLLEDVLVLINELLEYQLVQPT